MTFIKNKFQTDVGLFGKSLAFAPSLGILPRALSQSIFYDSAFLRGFSYRFFLKSIRIFFQTSQRLLLQFFRQRVQECLDLFYTILHSLPNTLYLSQCSNLLQSRASKRRNQLSLIDYALLNLSNQITFHSPLFCRRRVTFAPLVKVTKAMPSLPYLTLANPSRIPSRVVMGFKKNP